MPALYRMAQAGNGKTRRVHRLIVDEVLGRPAPRSVVVHHFDGDGFNNTRANLVICQDQVYHHLLHERQKAKKACGNPNFRRCRYCKRWSDPSELKFPRDESPRHQVCATRYERERRARKREERRRAPSRRISK